MASCSFGDIKKTSQCCSTYGISALEFFFSFHLYKLFYDEGGGAGGIGARGRVRISQDPARGIFWSPEGALPHIPEHGDQEEWKRSG